MKYIKQLNKDIKRYKYYIGYSVKSSLRAELSNTVLGYLWWILDPLLHMLIYTFLVRVIFSRGTATFPIFVFIALLPWKVATSIMKKSTRCIKSNKGIIKQIYLPKFTLPLVITLTNAIKLLFGILVLLIMLVFYKIPYTWHIFEAIPVLFVFLLFYYALSLIITHIGVMLDDMHHLIGYIIMFWFYASPGLWDVSQLPEKFRKIIWLNPNVTFFNSLRDAFMYGQSPNYAYLGIWLFIGILILVFGIKLLYKSDKNYTKVI